MEVGDKFHNNVYAELVEVWALVKDVRTYFREKYLEENSKQAA